MRDNSGANGGNEVFSRSEGVCAQKGIDAMDDVEKFLMRDTRYEIQDARYEIRDAGCWILVFSMASFRACSLTMKCKTIMSGIAPIALVQQSSKRSA